MEIAIIRAGLQTSVQDLGRPGFRDSGVPLSGAMDRFALRLANLLVGNPEGAAALEFLLNGPELEFGEDAIVAAGGGEFEGLAPWQPVRVRAGTRLRLGSARVGCRGYLAVAGALSVPSVLGSASVYLRGGFGGTDGRALRDGDVLQVPSVSRTVFGHWRVDPRVLPRYSGKPEVRVVRGAQFGQFDRTFLENPYRVSAQSDRMGLRLTGPRVARSTSDELRSSTVAPGTIQVPPDGQPIVLMADAQTIGGYPQIAHVISADLPLVAQLRPGESLHFSEVSLVRARELALARERALAMLREGLAHKIR